jgi:hypothetical protein
MLMNISNRSFLITFLFYYFFVILCCFVFVSLYHFCWTSLKMSQPTLHPNDVALMQTLRIIQTALERVQQESLVDAEQTEAVSQLGVYKDEDGGEIQQYDTYQTPKIVISSLRSITLLMIEILLLRNWAFLVSIVPASNPQLKHCFKRFSIPGLKIFPGRQDIEEFANKTRAMQAAIVSTSLPLQQWRDNSDKDLTKIIRIDNCSAWTEREFLDLINYLRDDSTLKNIAARTSEADEKAAEEPDELPSLAAALAPKPKSKPAEVQQSAPVLNSVELSLAFIPHRAFTRLVVQSITEWLLESVKSCQLTVLRLYVSHRPGPGRLKSKTLRFEMSDFYDLLRATKSSLTTLDISGLPISGLHGECLQQVTALCPKLRNLRLMYTGDVISSHNLSRSVYQLKHLESLTVSHAETNSDWLSSLVFDRMSHLRQIHINHSVNYCPSRVNETLVLRRQEWCVTQLGIKWDEDVDDVIQGRTIDCPGKYLDDDVSVINRVWG